MSYSPEEAQSLGTALPKEQARVRELMGLCREIGPAGAFAIRMMELSLQRADRAVMNGDVVEMLRCYEDLKGYSAGTPNPVPHRVNTEETK